MVNIGNLGAVGLVFFAECPRHSTNDILHSTKKTQLDKHFIGKWFFAEYFFRTLDKDFAEY
jgi:hypothetical protein